MQLRLNSVATVGVFLLLTLSAALSGFGAEAVTRKQRAQSLTFTAPETTESSACHYNLWLANDVSEGFGNAAVAVYADGALLTGLDSVSYPVTLRKAGWIIPVAAGQTISIAYTAGETVENGNTVWVTDPNGATVFTTKNSKSATYTIGTASCSCSYETNPDECSEWRVRTEWRSLSYCDQQNFIQALVTVRYATQDDGTNLYDEYITHHNSYSADIIGKSEFLPWHRAYLMRFEDDLRSLGGNFTCITIPYWDWSLDFSNESLAPVYAPFGGLREESCLETPFDSWYDPTTDTCTYRRHSGWIKGIWAASTYPMYLPQSGVQLAVTVNSSYVFIFKFMVRNPHKSVHNFVGGALGSMSKLSSPADPLFWLHHANVDRIWALWQDCWEYDQAGSEYEQWEDLTAERDAGVDDNLVSVWDGVNVTVRDILFIDKLKVSYPPVFEQWAQLNGRDSITGPNYCKWDWFDSTQQLAAGIEHRPQVYTDYQRNRHYETLTAYRDALEVDTPEYYSALMARLTKECDMGDAYHSDDFADMFNDQVDLNAKIGPSYLFRHVCKLLGRSDLWRLFYY